MSEKRRVISDIYGLRGWFQGGAVIDHLPRGTECELGTDDDGKPCLFCKGRRYPLDASLLYDVRTKSEPLR